MAERRPARRAARSQTAMSSPAITCAKGPGSPHCVDRIRVSRSPCEHRRGVLKARSQHQRCEVHFQKPKPVLGAGRRPVGEDFPAVGAICVFHTHEDPGAIVHDAEGGGDRPWRRTAKGPSLNPIYVHHPLRLPRSQRRFRSAVHTSAAAQHAGVGRRTAPAFKRRG